MRLILNEKKEAERIIVAGDVGNKVNETLSLLSRYYRDKGYSIKEIIQCLNDFMTNNYVNYNPDDWDKIINRYAKSQKYTLVQIDSIPITKNELLSISQIKDKKLEKLAFTLLVLAKFGNMRNIDNNNWVLVDEYDVLPRARIRGSLVAQYSCFYDLAKMDLITYSRRVDNINVRVGFIDNDSEIVLNITDLRELGYQYLMYKGEKYIKCAECGIVMKPSSNKSNNQKYCKECTGYQPIGYKIVKCCDCGKPFEINAKTINKERCDECRKIYRKKYQRELMRKRKNKI